MTQSRVASGIPAGGQFSAQTRTETDVRLSQTAPHAARHGQAERAAFAALATGDPGGHKGLLAAMNEVDPATATDPRWQLAAAFDREDILLEAAEQAELNDEPYPDSPADLASASASAAVSAWTERLAGERPRTVAPTYLYAGAHVMEPALQTIYLAEQGRASKHAEAVDAAMLSNWDAGKHLDDAYTDLELATQEAADGLSPADRAVIKLRRRAAQHEIEQRQNDEQATVARLRELLGDS
ncbi:MAG: hypothetical protein M3Y35_04700 [Actinomycetota bacterium]|nr:hypothetical protein [Actinomycetota bacterium]